MTATATGWAATQERLDKLKKPTRVLKLCQDPDIRDRYHKAREESEGVEEYLKNLPADASPETRAVVEQQAADAKKALTEATKAYEKATVTLTFQALERRALEALQNAHPASEKEEEEGSDFAFDTFAPALIAAASVDGMPEDYARQALDTWTASDAQDLWQAAWGVQHARRSDLGKG